MPRDSSQATLGCTGLRGGGCAAVPFQATFPHPTAPTKYLYAGQRAAKGVNVQRKGYMQQLFHGAFDVPRNRCARIQSSRQAGLESSRNVKARSPQPNPNKAMITTKSPPATGSHIDLPSKCAGAFSQTRKCRSTGDTSAPPTHTPVPSAR